MISIIKILPSFAVFFICFVLPTILFAQEVQEYVPIITIPGVNENQNTSTGFDSYINALYIFAITAGALLAVLKLVGAGVKYMFSDIVTTKMDAIRDIKGALLGLLLIIGAVVILNTVNTNLTNVDLNVNTLEDLPSGDFDIRIIDVIEMCEETLDCTWDYMNSEECTAVNGSFIPGSWWGLTGGTNLRDRCYYISRGPTECPAGQRLIYTQITYGIERTCIPIDDVPPTDTFIEVEDCIEGDPDGDCATRLMTRCEEIGRNPTLHDITFVPDGRVDDATSTRIGKYTAICRSIVYEQ